MIDLGVLLSCCWFVLALQIVKRNFQELIIWGLRQENGYVWYANYMQINSPLLVRSYWHFRIYTPLVTTISYLEIKLQEDLASHQEMVTSTGYKRRKQKTTQRTSRFKLTWLVLERRVSGEECLLFLQRVWVKTPEPTLSSSQPPMTPGPQDLMPLLNSLGTCTHGHICTYS